MISIALIALAFATFNSIYIICKELDKLTEKINMLEAKLNYKETSDKYKIN